MILLPLLLFFFAWQFGAAQAFSSQATSATALEFIRPSADHKHFVGTRSGKRFVVWGVNYDRDDAAHVFKGAKPLFYAPGVGDSLDFTSLHFYPKRGEVAGALAALKVYDLGKPLVVEEIFPLECGIDEAGEFIERSREFCDGWVSFYWGKTIAGHEAAGDIKSAVVARWLRYFQAKSSGINQGDISEGD